MQDLGYELPRKPIPRTPVNKSKWKYRSGTQMVPGIQRRQGCPHPCRRREASPEKATEGVRMNTSKLNESAPMIVRVVQGSLMAGHRGPEPFGNFVGPGVGGGEGVWGGGG